MSTLKLKYDLEKLDANYLLAVLDRVQTTGPKAAKQLLHIEHVLKNPINKAEVVAEQEAAKKEAEEKEVKKEEPTEVPEEPKK